MDQALAGLIGAVVGGLLTGGSNWTLEGRRQRRADMRATVDGQRELREAARLIDDELVAGVVTLAEAAQAGTWPRTNEELPVERWRTYGPVVARSDVGETTWTPLAEAYQTVREVNSRILVAHRNGAVTLDADDRDYLLGVQSTLEDALEAMRQGLPGRSTDA